MGRSPKHASQPITTHETRDDKKTKNQTKQNPETLETLLCTTITWNSRGISFLDRTQKLDGLADETWNRTGYLFCALHVLVHVSVSSVSNSISNTYSVRNNTT